MCRFCVEHGEGKRWYLNANNYLCDLESDARRRDYVIDFVAGFPQMRTRAITWAERLSKAPRPVGDAGRAAISRHMQTNHFGQPVPIEDCEQIFAIATSITVIPCICRMHEPSADAEEVCILVTTRPVEPYVAQGFSGYANGPGLDDFHTLSPNEAMDLLRACERRGLMHSIWTFRTPFAAAVCNCNLESGCMAMKMTVGFQTKLMWRGEDVARMDADACIHCGACVTRCPFGAITKTDRGEVRLLTEECWGCGICRSACRHGALRLVDRRTVPAVSSLW